MRGLNLPIPLPRITALMTTQLLHLIETPSGLGVAMRRRAQRWLDTVRASKGGGYRPLTTADGNPRTVIHEGGTYQGTSCHTCGYDSRTTIRSSSRSKRDLRKLLGEGGRLRVQSSLVHQYRKWLLWRTPIYTRHMASLRWERVSSSC